MTTKMAKAAFIEPMLLLRSSSLPDGDDWIREIKLDGYRAIAFKSAGKLHLRSRNDNDMAVRYPVIAKALAMLPENTVVDGELVALDEDDRPSFNLPAAKLWKLLRPALVFHLRPEIIAPARRACGLASNDAEKSLDRLMLEPGIGPLSRIPSVLASPSSDSAPLIKEHALTFVTYVRRLTQSITTLAGAGRERQERMAQLESLAKRLETISSVLQGSKVRSSGRQELADESEAFEADGDMTERQIQRMQRQVLILESAVAGMVGGQVGI